MPLWAIIAGLYLAAGLIIYLLLFNRLTLKVRAKGSDQGMDILLPLVVLLWPLFFVAFIVIVIAAVIKWTIQVIRDQK